jgi:hypothetical protein
MPAVQQGGIAAASNRADQLRLRARARAKLTVYQPLAVERVGYEQRPVIGHEINPTVGRDLVALGVMCVRTDTRSERLRTSDP